MTEKLLQFIWKNRYFNQQGLDLVSGETLVIEYPGDSNNGQGPDFVQARIRIDGRFWTGSVELHLFSTGWIKHCHGQDENYHNVILHVVWKKEPVELKRNIPELELCHRISRLMLDTYAGWMQKPAFVPCERSVYLIDEKKWARWSEKLVMQRLERRAKKMEDSLRRNRFHWEEQLWWTVAAGFGYPANSAAFESVARSIPFALLAKLRQDPLQLEAMLSGQAGLLSRDFTDPFPEKLKREYRFLKRKYSLKDTYQSVHFFRMRPESFPGIRLSQLAVFFSGQTALFAWIAETSFATVQRRLMVCAQDYWDNHFVFDKASTVCKKRVGHTMAATIIINSIIPLIYCFGKYQSDSGMHRKSLEWLEQMSPEQNHLITKWMKMGLSAKKAGNTQSLIELKKEYCDRRRCLECDIGKQILKTTDEQTF